MNTKPLESTETNDKGHREAYISTLHSERPILIESMTADGFFFTADFKVPVGVLLFLKYDKAEMKKGLKFEILEVEEIGNSYRYLAAFIKEKFDFDHWENKHKY